MNTISTNTDVVEIYATSLNHKENIVEFVRIVQTLMDTCNAFEILGMYDKNPTTVFTPRYANLSAQDAYNRLKEINYDDSGADDSRRKIISHIKTFVVKLMQHFQTINQAAIKAGNIQNGTGAIPSTSSEEESDKISIAMLNPKNVRVLALCMTDAAKSLDFAFSPHDMLSPNTKDKCTPEYLLSALGAIQGALDLMLRRVTTMVDNEDPSSAAMVSGITSIIWALDRYFINVHSAIALIVTGYESLN